ncbi:MAG: hypothetical protein QOF28_1796 [Actinomycetota bacterium]|jgi:hypothetical protein|nr:hypothetical protein [Actinomycetota bacterium]
MIRFSWLQSRTQSAVAFGALALLAIVLAFNGAHLVHIFDTNIATCAARGDCETVRGAFLSHNNHLRTWLGILVIVVPGIAGVFWGAPLVARELESGTYRLAWTQSVSRMRWLAVKLAVVGLTSMAVAGLFSLVVTWWASPLDTVNGNRFAPALFDQRGIVAIGYAAFAFALGVTAGAIIKRTVPTMATTLVAFVFARVATMLWIRPHFLAPAHRTASLDAVSMGFGRTNSGTETLMPAPANIPNAWVYSTRIVDDAGHALTSQALASTCPRLATILAPPPAPGHAARAQVPEDVKSALNQCVAKVGTKYHAVTTYQPASRYWSFQWYELALFLGAAVVLCGLCFWWIRRRLA